MAAFGGREYRIGPAVAGSLAGTVVFGVMMQTLDMMPMVAALVGSSSTAVGWIVHLAIGAFFGVGFAVAAAHVPLRPASTGILWGLALWAVGAQVVMPLWLGMPSMVFRLDAAGPWYSLMGHIVYGFITGAVAGRLAPGGARDVRPKAA